MKSLWKVKGFEKQTSWKVVLFSRENEQKECGADMYINNVWFSQCRTTHTHTPQQSNTAQRHSTTHHSTATQQSNTAHHSTTQHDTATQHSDTAQRHSTAHHSTATHSLLPFVRVCSGFLTTLTCRALYGKALCHSCSLPFTRACLDVSFTLTCGALDGKSHCHSCSLPFVRAPFRTPQENRVVAVTFETTKKCCFFYTSGIRGTP